MVNFPGELRRGSSPPSHTFQQRHRSQSAICTNTDDSFFACTHRRQFFRRLTQYPCAGRAERVADGDAAAVGIQALPRKFPQRIVHARFFAQECLLYRGDVAEQLRSEGFVDFPEIDIGEGEAVACEQARDSVGGCHE